MNNVSRKYSNNDRTGISNQLTTDLLRASVFDYILCGSFASHQLRLYTCLLVCDNEFLQNNLDNINPLKRKLVAP
jgi:hypothetical protein